MSNLTQTRKAQFQNEKKHNEWLKRSGARSEKAKPSSQVGEPGVDPAPLAHPHHLTKDKRKESLLKPLHQFDRQFSKDSYWGWRESKKV